MDHYRARHAQSFARASSLYSRTAQRQISYLDQQVALGADHCARSYPAGPWRMVLPVLVYLPADRGWPAFHLAGKFGYAHVGIAALPYRGHFQEQFLGGDPELR